MTQQTAEPETLQTPVVLVGDKQHDDRVVMRRIFVRCNISTPERGSFIKLCPLEEIPLMRKLYAQYGGSIKVVGGLEHPSFGRYTVQDLNDYTLRNVITYLKRTYNNVLIQKRLHQFFDDVYGVGEHCSFLDKMRSLVEEWDGSLEAANVEALLQRHFPHVATRSTDDILSVPGLDGLTNAPKVGVRAQSMPAIADEKVERDALVPEAPVPGAARPETQQEKERIAATILTGGPAPDPDLAAFLIDPGKTSGNPLLENQAWAVASLVAQKPVYDWTGDDYKGIPGLSKKNHPRISKLVGAYLDSHTPEGGQDAQDDGGDPPDDMFA